MLPSMKNLDKTRHQAIHPKLWKGKVDSSS